LEILFEIDGRVKLDQRFIFVAVLGHIRDKAGTIFLILAKKGGAVNDQNFHAAMPDWKKVVSFVTILSYS
jgi:hypothetical protein